MKTTKQRKAFTLVELLIVIAIIGVLAGLMFPALSGAFKQVNKVVSQNNASGIAKAWMNYTKMGSKPRILARPNIYEWAATLAEKADLNTPSMWLLSFDPLVQTQEAMKGVVATVANKQGNEWKLNPDFKTFPISWEVANATQGNAQVQTPLLWTRGLLPSGYWDPRLNPFGADSGGHIAFVDGHVTWYDSLHDESTKQGMLMVYGQTNRTANIAQAIFGGTPNILRSLGDQGQAQ